MKIVDRASELVNELRRSTLADEERGFSPRKLQLVEELRRHTGNVAAVARHFGRAPVQIRRWIKRYSIDLASFRDDREGSAANPTTSECDPVDGAQ